MRVIVAGRLSRKADTDQTGFDSQEREAVRWAEDRGHHVVAVVADFKSGRSGLAARPNLRPWVADETKLAGYEGIVTLKLDRLTRGDWKETTDLETWAASKGKTLLTADGLVFPCEGDDGIRWDLAKRMAHAEWLRIRERYTRMQRTRREDGSHIGRVPYGLRTVPAVNDQGRAIKALALDEDEADVIRDAARWYLAGDTLDAICDRLNAAGRLPRPPKPEDDAPFGRLRNGKPRTGPVLWVPKTLSGALRSEAIVGRVNNGYDRKAKRRYTLKAPAILDRATWQAVKDRMDIRSTRKGVKWSRNTALLTGIIECGRCGGRKMYRNGSATKFYWCHGCNAHIALDYADQAVRDLVALDDRHPPIETVIPGDDHADAILDVKADMAEAVAAEDFARLDDLRRRLDDLRALPVTLPHVETRPAELTVAEQWAALDDDDARRRWLLDHKARVVYADYELTVYLGDWVLTDVAHPVE